MIKLIPILILLLGFNAMAQDARLQVAVSNTTVTNTETFQYQITADCNCTIISPDLSDFEVLDRQQGQHSSSTMMNGVSSKTCTTSLTYLLKAKNKGSFNIGSATAECKHGNKDSEELTMTVVDANEAHSANEGVAKFYYKIESSKSVVYVGEPFVITFYLYTDKLPEDMANISRGDAVGLFRQPIYDETSPDHVFTRYNTKVKGKVYNVIELKQEVCFSDRAGKIQIDPYFGRAVEQYGFFDNIYMDGYSNELDIMVKELPGEVPEDFYGLAGSFEMTSEISKKSLSANHAFEIKVRIEGVGNFHLMKDPVFNLPKDTFLVSGPEIKEELQYSAEGVNGWREYTYIITPTKPGDYQIPPYTFSYFDWKEKKFKTASTLEILMHIKKGKEPEIKSSSSGNDQILVENDIRHIHATGANFFIMDDILFGRLLFWICFGSPLGALFIFILLRKRKSKTTDEEKSKIEQKQVRKSALKELQKLNNQKTANSIKSVKTILDDYLMTHLKIGRSALSKQVLIQHLADKSIAKETQDYFELVWNKLEMSQYGRVSDQNISELINEVEKLIQQLNKNFK